jgi:hypothetical protein
VLEWVIARSAQRRRPPLLDTTAAENVAWYERFGSVVAGGFELPRGYRGSVVRL